MRRPNAFTLRDLVALLCLAGLGLPILAASLPGTKGASAAERCRTTLASLTRCVLVYTEQNRGYMPVYQHRFTNGYIRAPDNTYKAAVCFQDTDYAHIIDPATGLLADVRGLGRLYTRRLARPAEVFYCPAERDERYTLAYYPKPWGTAVSPSHASQFIRAGYMWNPWVMRIPGGGANQWTYDDRLVLRRHPADRPLLCDLMWSMIVTGHTEPGSASWNLAYPDGRVVSFQDPQLYEILAQGADASSDWATFNQLIRPHLPGATAGGTP